jgi:DNA-binding MarR family transcriptional regulator
VTQLAIEEYLCTRIRAAEQALMAHHESVLRPWGLTMAQYTVLLELSRVPGQSGSQLARASGVTQQTMASVLKLLESKQLIHRETSPVHAKVQIVTPTAEGEELLRRAYAEVSELERQFGRAFTAKERTTLCELLDRAAAVLAEHTQPAEEAQPPQPTRPAGKRSPQRRQRAR